MLSLHTFLLGFSITTLTILTLLLLPLLIQLLTPPAILALVHYTILFFTATLILLILRQVLLIPLHVFRDTAYWWYLRNLYIPRFAHFVGRLYRQYRGWGLATAAVGGLVLSVGMGFELDLWLVVVAHWVALLAACVSAEELAAGLEWVRRHWRFCVQIAALVVFLMAF